MATPVFCCGGECGVLGPHFINNGTFSTTTFRSGLRSLRINPSAAVQNALTNMTNAVNIKVARFYLNFATLPNATVAIVVRSAGTQVGLVFKSSDSKLYCGTESSQGATGFTVTTGVWYIVDLKIDCTNNPWTVDAQVNGTALGQFTNAAAGSAFTNFNIGSDATSSTSDWFLDDMLVSETNGDYPLGAGYVLSYIPNADGTHNIAGAADFKHGTGTTPAGTDITNASTDAWQDIDKRPLVTSAAGAETLINMIAPPNATDYVEIQFEDSVESAPPRAVEVIIGINQAGTGNGNMEVRLNDNGTMGTIYTATGVAGVAIATGVVFKRAHFADPPSAASAWVLGGAGDGDFNDLRIRFGSPAAVDANPDQYLIEAMFEAEYAEIFSATRKPVIINQARVRAAVR